MKGLAPDNHINKEAFIKKLGLSHPIANSTLAFFLEIFLWVCSFYDFCFPFLCLNIPDIILNHLITPLNSDQSKI